MIATRVALAATLLAVVLTGCSGASDASRTEEDEPVRTVNGLTVYLGVMPAALIRGHDPGTATAMHTSTPLEAESHHVMVALFDAATGTRVTASRVIGTLRIARGAVVAKPLEPMTVNDALTYGNYFVLPENGSLSTLEVRIERPQAPTTIVIFRYRHFS